MDHYIEQAGTEKSCPFQRTAIIDTLKGGTYPLAHFLGNFREKTKKVPTRTVSRKLPEISRKFSKKLTALLPLAHF